MKRWWIGALAAVGLGLGGCGTSSSCKDACDKLVSCNINSSGFSCDASCGAPDDTCARCLNSTSCGDISAAKCASSCPDATFTPK